MAKKLWGGRFKKKADPLMDKFSKSIDYDCKLAEYDCLGSIYHVQVLKNAQIITSEEAKKLKTGLTKILSLIRKGKLIIDSKAEDIHTFIQNTLEKDIGKLALKLHTARSRNEQVAFDTKLYCLDNIFKTLEETSKVIKALSSKALAYKDFIIPGFTHLQHAEPVSLVYYLGAYMEMLKRDNKRLVNIADSIELTFGSGALAGTGIEKSFYDIKDVFHKKHLKSARNPIDAVSDRDFVLEILSALSIMGMHLSRMAEDFIIWLSKEFSYLDLDEAFCTGSSLMPHKKNADVLELIRGYTGRLSGNFLSVFTMMKGLPLAYNRDMQLDKEPLFNSFEIIHNELKLLTKVISSVKFNKEKIKEQLNDESLYATTLAHYLVTKGVAFKNAHDKIGKLISYSLEKNKNIKDMSDKELKKFSRFLDKKTVKKFMDPVFSVKLKTSINKN